MNARALSILWLLVGCTASGITPDAGPRAGAETGDSDASPGGHPDPADGDGDGAGGDPGASGGDSDADSGVDEPGPGPGPDPVEDPGVQPLDAARLDRQAGLGVDGCGYPGPGDQGYGIELTQRMENFALVDCSLQEHDFGELFCKRDDAYGDYNRAILLSLGAGWCEPCKQETLELPAVYDRYHDEGLEIVQVLFQDELSQRPASSFCREWKDDYDLRFLVLLDQTWEFYPVWLQDVQASTPVTVLVDANANIRFKMEGQVVPNLEAEIEKVLASPYGP